MGNRIVAQALPQRFDAYLLGLGDLFSLYDRHHAVQCLHHLVIAPALRAADHRNYGNCPRLRETCLDKCRVQVRAHFQFGTSRGKSVEQPTTRLDKQLRCWLLPDMRHVDFLHDHDATRSQVSREPFQDCCATGHIGKNEAADYGIEAAITFKFCELGGFKRQIRELFLRRSLSGCFYR